ncbi:MAG: SUF system NifU family Fe-S cluster assembly protein [Anaerolineales bacterium]|jgi:nitrogen fixation NifU-like protein|nr:SUF system NifU family Fe-S cluster assembly protein [Anaerolineales bacterium]MBX3004291.1 SUF system NifU family Fe-S cluster assembly protein [Anaerolineales bacterium]
MDDLYREVIIDRYQNPRFSGTLDPHTHSYEDDNPVCGDHIRIDLRVDANDVVSEAKFTGEGCSISQASADLLMEKITGMPVAEVRQLGKQDILDLLGIELGPVRLKCALLSLKVLKGGVYGLDEVISLDELAES